MHTLLKLYTHACTYVTYIYILLIITSLPPKDLFQESLNNELEEIQAIAANDRKFMKVPEDLVQDGIVTRKPFP